MRILHSPSNPAGIASGLASGERLLGHDSTVLSLFRQFTRYEEEECLNLGVRTRPGRYLGLLKAFLDHRSGYDVYNFLSGSTFLHFPQHGLHHLDLALLDRSATVGFTYVGSDARRILEHPSTHLRQAVQESIGGSFPARTLRRLDIARQRSIDKAARHADYMFAANPDLLRWLPATASFLPYPVAAYCEPGRAPHAFFADDKVHIVHAPTDRSLKGTRFVLEAIRRLEEDMPDRFHFTLIEGLSHREAAERYRHADLFVDQLLVGWYGAAATECMRMGIPSIAYIDEVELSAVPRAMAESLPVIRADPSSLTSVLRCLVRDRDQLIEIGQVSRSYAESWHDPRIVAEQAVQAYRVS